MIEVGVRLQKKVGKLIGFDKDKYSEIQKWLETMCQSSLQSALETSKFLY